MKQSKHNENEKFNKYVFPAYKLAKWSAMALKILNQIWHPTDEG